MAIIRLKNEDTQEFEEITFLTGEQGREGEKGEDGYTPQKGIDYFTEEEIIEMAATILEYLPQAEEEVF